MGSLVRKKKAGNLLTAVTAILLVGLLASPALAGTSLEQKVETLTMLGLDGTDPAVVKAAQEASTLYAVDVVPGDGNKSVVLRLSDMPAYKWYLYKEENRLVVDLRNTINLSPSPVSTLGKDDSIKKVRNSQFKVTPTLISRVVVDLAANTTPEIRSEGNNLIICTPTSVVKSEMPEASQKQKEVPNKVVSVPAIHVNTETPKVDYMFAKAAAAPAPEVAEVAIPENIQVDEGKTERPTETASTSDTSELSKPLSMVASLLQEPEAEASEVEQLPVAAPEPETSEPPVAVAALAQEPAAEPEAVADPSTPPQTDPVVTPEAAPVEQPVAPVAEPAVTEPNSNEQEERAEAPEPSGLASQIEIKSPPQASPDGELVSLNFRGADLGAVLDILARKGNFNILAGKDVRGTVTVRLVDVPLNVALNAILNVNGYGYVKMDNIIRIMPLSQLGREVITTTETFMLSYATANKAKGTLTGFLTPNGSIQTDDRTNMLIVTDVPNNMDRIRTLIPQIDKRVQQVLIEVLILDSVLSDAADLGIQWTLFDRNAHTLVDQVPSATTTGQSGSRVTLPVTANALNLSFATLMGDFKLDAFIQATVDNTQSRILANPKILTVNNEAARIEIIEEFPYSDVTQTSSGGQLSNITFKDIGTKLEVRPQITHDGHVILKVAPEQNFPSDITATGVPIVDTRRAETTLIVKDHQTVVLGGLRLNRKIKSIIKVPLLGDLPGMKYAFRSVESDDSDTELLVFITVHIVESPPLLADQKIKFNEIANLPRNPGTTIDLVR